MPLASNGRATAMREQEDSSWRVLAPEVDRDRSAGAPVGRHVGPVDDGARPRPCSSVTWRRMGLIDALPTDPDADSIYAAFTAWVSGQGLTLYPHQDEAVIEV